jgi:glucose/mannose-6-phosphate isomerase
LADGFRSGHQLGVIVPPRIRQIAVVGMGGSAIAGDLLSNLADAETDRSVLVLRTPDLPKGVDANWFAVAVSYSGDTWETLRAYDELARRGTPRVVVSSGGLLSERAAVDGTPCLVVPAGLPPRAAAGYLFGGLLGLMDPIFPETNELRLGRAISRLESQRRGITGAAGGPTRLAEKVGKRTPLVYAETAWLGLARRWKTQLEENAKRLSHFDVLPELFHNALVPWDAMSKVEAGRRAAILLEWSRQDSRTEGRFRYLERLLKARGARVERVRIQQDDRLTAILQGVWWGDYTSLALAEDSRVDPLEVNAITRMKHRLAGS